jgi:hypothetical protein
MLNCLHFYDKARKIVTKKLRDFKLAVSSLQLTVSGLQLQVRCLLPDSSLQLIINNTE